MKSKLSENADRDNGQIERIVMQKTADIEFLVNRTMKAGTCNFTGERDTGMSSNSIVAIAYGMRKLKDQILPSDMSDLRACRNMWNKLPEHRKTDDAKKAMENAENFIYWLGRKVSEKNGRISQNTNCFQEKPRN